MSAPTNYKVLFTHFGPYNRGDVLPGYLVEVGNDVEELLLKRIVERTSAPVTVEVVPPTLPAADAVPDDVYQERNRLQKENAGLKADAALHKGRADELEKHRESLKVELGKYVEENGAMKQTIAALQADVESLTKPAAKSTAPAAAGTPKQPAPPATKA